MTRGLVLVGKIGPAFGDRPSAAFVETRCYFSRCTNFPKADRADALRVALEQIAPLHGTLRDLLDEEEGVSIRNPGARSHGHRYVLGRVNAHCPVCTDQHTARRGRYTVALTCDFDDQEDE